MKINLTKTLPFPKLPSTKWTAEGVGQSSSSSSSDGTNSSFSSKKLATFLLIAAPMKRPTITPHTTPTMPKGVVFGSGNIAPDLVLAAVLHAALLTLLSTFDGLLSTPIIFTLRSNCVALVNAIFAFFPKPRRSQLFACGMMFFFGRFIPWRGDTRSPEAPARAWNTSALSAERISSVGNKNCNDLFFNDFFHLDF